MKKIITYLLLGVFAALMITSCTEDEETFTDVLLLGKWQSGTVFYKYIGDGTGSTWDTGDDVNESEAQQFTWTLEQSTLTHIHIMEIGGSVPKTYTVTALTSTTLMYEDDFGKKFSFTKVSN